MSDSHTAKTPRAQLSAFYKRNGYFRRLNRKRRDKEGMDYKKGDEVRLVARTRKELAQIARLVRRAGFEPGKPFAKAKQYALPIYGRDEVARFLKFIRA